MTLFSRLFSLFGRGLDDAPPPPPDIRVAVQADDDPEDIPGEQAIEESRSDPPDLPDVAGINFAIDYLDSRGRASTRRVTLHRFRMTSKGALLLYARCHERRAERSFRVDRIQSVIDLDGEVRDCGPFFSEALDIDLDELRGLAEQGKPAPISTTSAGEPAASVAQPAQPAAIDHRSGEEQGKPAAKVPSRKPRKPAASKPGFRQRAAARDGLRLVAAIGRCDGDFGAAEQLEVLNYIVAESAAQGIETRQEDRIALAGYISRQRPDQAVFERCLDEMERASLSAQQRFLRAAARVVAADGEEHPEELAILEELSSRLGNVDANQAASADSA